jgi:hypothetical protein
VQASTFEHLRTLSNKQIVGRVKYLARKERHTSAELIGHLAVFDERQLYAAEACSSLFSYCTEILKLSEHSAYRRIEAARAARRFPIIVRKLAEGTLNLTGATLLAPHLTPDNYRALLQEAEGKTRRQIEEIVARIYPLPDLPASVRRLPDRRVRAASALRANTSLDPSGEGSVGPVDDLLKSEVIPEYLLNSLATQHTDGSGEGVDGHEPAAEADTTDTTEDLSEPDSQRPLRQDEAALYRRRGTISPSSPGRYSFKFTAGRETHEKLRQLQDLLSGQIPDRDMVKIFDLALTTLLEKLLRQRHAIGLHDNPRASRAEQAAAPTSEHELKDEEPSSDAMIPAAVLDPVQGVQATTTAATTTAISNPDQVIRRSRYIPARIRREVWKRDKGQCTYTNPDGRRCTARSRLQYHHLIPFAEGGPSTIENLTLRCRTHNEYDARLYLIEKEWLLIREAGRTAAGNEPRVAPRLNSERRKLGTSGLCGAHAP